MCESFRSVIIISQVLNKVVYDNMLFMHVIT